LIRRYAAAASAAEAAAAAAFRCRLPDAAAALRATPPPFSRPLPLTRHAAADAATLALMLLRLHAIFRCL